MKNSPTYVFFTWEDISYSRTGVIFSGLKKSHSNTFLKTVELGSILHMARQIRKFVHDSSIENPIYVIGSPCGLLVLSLRLAAPNAKIVFDTGWPQVDALLMNRRLDPGKSLKYLKMYFLDFISIKLSNLVAVESKSQLKRMKVKFIVRSGKLFVSYTGFNEQALNSAPVSHLEPNVTGIILFRGKINAEAGIALIAEVSKLLPTHLKFVVISGNLPINLEFAPGTEIISGRLSDDSLAEYYSRSLLAIGQLGKSKRIAFTLPHKFFEAAFFGIPYLTPETNGLTELISATEYKLFCNDLTATGVAKMITDFANDKDEQVLAKQHLLRVYSKSISQEIISRNFNATTNRFFSKSRVDSI
jgi:hypothetical protein